MDAGKYSTTSERRKTGRGGTAWCVAVVLMVLALGWWGLRSPSRPLELPKTEFTVKKVCVLVFSVTATIGLFGNGIRATSCWCDLQPCSYGWVDRDWS